MRRYLFRYLALAAVSLFAFGCYYSLDSEPDTRYEPNSNDPGDESSPYSTQQTDDNEQMDCATLRDSFVLPAQSQAFSNAVEDASCAVVGGNLVIKGELGSIRVLRDLERLDVAGDVSVETLGGLRDLSALQALRDVGGDLNVESNKSLVSTAGLDNLRQVGDDFRIADNPKLRQVHGPGSLVQIGSDLRVVNNPALRKVVGFDGLAAIAEYDGRDDRPDPAGSTFGENPETRRGAVDPHLIIANNPKLEVLRGFPNLSDIDGDLRLESNHALTTVRGFGRLEFMTGELVVKDQPNLKDISAIVRTSCLRQVHLEGTGLTDLSALRQLWEIGRLRIVDNPNLERLGDWREELRLRGPVVIRDNQSLTALDGIAGVDELDRSPFQESDLPTEYAETANAECVPLESGDDTPTGSLTIANNDSLPSLGSLDLEIVEGDLVVRDNDRLGDLVAFSRLTDIEGDLHIQGNDALRRIEGFDRLEGIDGGFAIAGHDKLRRIQGFPRLGRVDGELRLENNAALETVAGFDKLDDAGRVVIRNNPVTDLDGLARLTFIDGLVFEQNDAVTALEDFASLTKVHGPLRIERNANLRSLRNFDELRKVEDGFIVQENPVLSNCEAQSVADSVRTDYVLIEQNAACQ